MVLAAENLIDANKVQAIRGMWSFGVSLTVIPKRAGPEISIFPNVPLGVRSPRLSQTDGRAAVRRNDTDPQH